MIPAVLAMILCGPGRPTKPITWMLTSREGQRESWLALPPSGAAGLAWMRGELPEVEGRWPFAITDAERARGPQNGPPHGNQVTIAVSVPIVGWGYLKEVGRYRIRTCGLWLRRPTLYPTELNARALTRSIATC